MTAKRLIIGFVLTAIALIIYFPKPHYYRFKKTGVVVDSVSGKPIQDAVVVYGVHRECGSVGGASSRESDLFRFKTDADGHYSIHGSHISWDWISVVIFTGCGSQEQEYVCKEGYAPRITTYDWRVSREKPVSPLEERVVLEPTKAPFKWQGDFKLSQEMSRDCKIEIDYGGTPKKKR